MSQIELAHVSRAFGGIKRNPGVGLSDISLSVKSGQLLVLTGPSGSGKTTLLRLIAGLDQPSSGTVHIDGRPVSSIPHRAHPVAMAFQNPALYPDMTVGDNLSFGLRVRGIAPSEIRQRIQEAVRILNLAECLHRKPAELSGGERQRVALGRALVRRLTVLLLDEPLSSLDPQLRSEMRALIRDLHERLGATTVYVTHDHTEAMLLGQRLAVLRAGRLEQVAAPSELYNHPGTLFVAAFFGFPPINVFSGILRESGGLLLFREQTGCFEVNLKRSPQSMKAVPGDHPVILGVRPEHVLLESRSLAAHSNGGSLLQGTIEVTETTGPECFVTIRLGQTKCVARSGPGQQFVSGSPIQLRFDSAKLNLFDSRTGCALE